MTPHGKRRPTVSYLATFVIMAILSSRGAIETASSQTDGFATDVAVSGDSVLIAANRATGTVTVVDISDITHPKQIRQFDTAGNPGRVLLHNGFLVIPDGYNGLLVSRAEETAIVRGSIHDQSVAKPLFDAHFAGAARVRRSADGP